MDGEGDHSPLGRHQSSHCLIFERNLWFIPLSVLVWAFSEGIMRANLFLYETFRGQP
jgi:hypothetical protein